MPRLHMFGFPTGSYKPPREFNWVVGVILLVLTLLLSFTGYLLPWDQLSIWAVTVGSNMARATPLLGYEGPFAQYIGANPIYDARAFLFGGGEIGPHTLLRLCTRFLHCIFFRSSPALFMAVHFWRIRRDGFRGPPVSGGTRRSMQVRARPRRRFDRGLSWDEAVPGYGCWCRR
jgi:quinol-cytochrome oxidoreductase complex cytochrome b subunit